MIAYGGTYWEGDMGWRIWYPSIEAAMNHLKGLVEFGPRLEGWGEYEGHGKCISRYTARSKKPGLHSCHSLREYENGNAALCGSL